MESSAVCEGEVGDISKDISTNRKMQQRIEYIDIAKGLGMVLVVFGHMTKMTNPLGLAIWSFHMPLFFILSGLCFNAAKYPDFIPFLKRRIVTLALPLLIFSAILHILSCMLELRPYPVIDISHFDLPGAGWFVLTLFFAELIYFWLNRMLEFTPPNLNIC